MKPSIVSSCETLWVKIHKLKERRQDSIQKKEWSRDWWTLSLALAGARARVALLGGGLLGGAAGLFGGGLAGGLGGRLNDALGLRRWDGGLPLGGAERVDTSTHEAVHCE